MHHFRFSVVIEKDEEGYTAFCPELQGCYAQGETYEEIPDTIRDAIRLQIDDRTKSGEKISQARLISLTTVDVSVRAKDPRSSCRKSTVLSGKTLIPGLTGTPVWCCAGNYYQAAGRRNRGGRNADWRYV
jgi:predicted RNase H-like HicB family nuclease